MTNTTLLYLLAIFILLSCKKVESKNNTNIKLNTWIGNYELSTKAISEYDNKQFTIYYNINVESETSAMLSISAKHSEDYWCEGNYRLTIENNIIHAKGKCDQDDINDFYIKYSDGSYFIKSKRFENQDWLKIIKNKN